MFRKLRERMGAKATAIGVVLVLIGSSVALALPDEAIDGQEIAAANQAAAAEMAATAQENAENGEGDGPPEAVTTFLVELHSWVECIQTAVRDGALAHAEQQSDPETRVEDAEFDAEAAKEPCGDKPINPNDGIEENEAEEEGEGRPEDAGPPAGILDDIPPAHATNDE